MSRSSHSTTPVSNWTTMTTTVDRLAPMSFIGRFHSARRCIDPPRIELSAVDGATTYDIVVSPLTASDTVIRAFSANAEVELAEAWPHLPIGMLQITGRAFDRDGQLLGVTPLKSLVKAPDWDGRFVEPLDYHAAGAGVIDYLCHGLPIARVHPDDPAYMWHAAVRPVGNDTGTDLQFPALCYPMLINLFLTGHQLKPGDDLIARSTRLADFLIDHPIINDGPLAGLPMSTIGQDGKGGLYEEDRTTLVRIGWTGVTMLDLAAATGNQRYVDYAVHLGEVLLATQQEDGSWPYRVRLSDAEVVESYTAAGTMALFLLERLADQTDDPRYQRRIRSRAGLGTREPGHDRSLATDVRGCPNPRTL